MTEEESEKEFYDLLNHNEEFDRWEKMTLEDREKEIKWAMR